MHNPHRMQRRIPFVGRGDLTPPRIPHRLPFHAVEAVIDRPPLRRSALASPLGKLSRPKAVTQTVKELPNERFRREEKCEREPSGFPFTFHNPAAAGKIAK